MNTNPSDGEFGRQGAKGPIVPKTAAEALRPEAGTPPPSKRSRASRSQVVVFLNFFLSIAILLVLASGAALYFGMQAFVEPGPSANGDTFMIKPNTGVQEIADQLERRSLISDARIFRLGVRATGNESALKAGEYAIKPRASMRDIMELFKSGKSVMYSLTIPEGLTVQQALQRMADQEALTGDMPATLPPEGSIATDTLRFTRGDTRQQMIDKLVADQKKLVEDVWSHRAPDLPIANIDDFVTLASIVEKETGRSDERSRVAAVFLNRLAKGMRLQSDPTIIYGLFGGKGKPADRPIYQSDLDKQTPYNTYLVKGLPPTPIANPGRAALEAVANPSKTSDLYFVADGNGGHVFAATLEEHNQN
ncbi:MAG: endolytic transglycosylase MltG, partial [Mesorhizobium sp.]